ncbi:MAG: DUF1176 domain-containing protein [Pseudomonadota bacterium]
MKKLSILFGLSITSAIATANAQDFEAFAWSGSCDNELYCVARASGKAPTGETMQLKLERPVDPDAAIFVTVRLPSEQELTVGVPVTITVLESGFSESTKTQRVYRGNEMTFGGAADRPLVKELKANTTARIDVELTSQGSVFSYNVPLTGVTSVLAEFDRLQGRAERADAAVLGGGLPFPGQVRERVKTTPEPQPEPAPVQEAFYPPVRYTDLVYDEDDVPDEVLMTGYRVFECDFPFVLEGYGAQVYGVTDFLELWMVPCNPADVNVDYYITLHSDGQTDFYEFKETPFGDNRFGLVTNPLWNNETRQLTTWTLYGPDGDCGSFATYQYVSEDDEFDLIRFQEKPVCDGVRSVEDDYPLVWSAD